MNFNKDRFVSFARYDLTTNMAFYRNLTLITVLGTLGFAMVFFFARLLMWESVTPMYSVEDDVIDSSGGVFDYTHYNSMFVTSCVLLEFLSIMWVIFAGCWAHNLRNKQSRIVELTLPASNIEKFLWHTGLMVIGGAILCFASLLLADAVNAIFTLLMTPVERGLASVTVSVYNVMSMNVVDWNFFFPISIDEETRSVLHFADFFIISLALCNTMIYLFGNSVKYKYNIILTYITLYALSIALSILLAIGMNVIYHNGADDYELGVSTSFNAVVSVKWFCGIVGTLALILSAALPVWSYKLYTKAQITSRLNK